MKAIEKPQLIINLTLVLLLTALALILLVSGCTGERIEGNRDLLTQERSPASFQRLIVQGDIIVRIIPDSVTRASVRAESNVLPYLRTESDGTTLLVEFTPGISLRTHYPVEVFLFTPSIKSINQSGSGTIECMGFSEPSVNLQLSGSGSISGNFITDHIETRLSGSGIVALSGSAAESDLSISGSGRINAAEMYQTHCQTNISGSGEIVTAVSETLNATISGSGNVWYLGNPAISSRISGSGRVLPY
jgi:hypothetical protein